MDRAFKSLVNSVWREREYLTIMLTLTGERRKRPVNAQFPVLSTEPLLSSVPSSPAWRASNTASHKNTLILSFFSPPRCPPSHFCLLRRKEISSKGTLKNQEQNRRQRWRSSSYRTLDWVHLREREAKKQRIEREWLCTVQRWTDTAVVPQTTQLCWWELLYTTKHLPTAESTVSFFLLRSASVLPLPPFKQHNCTTLTLGLCFECVVMSSILSEGLQSCF